MVHNKSHFKQKSFWTKFFLSNSHLEQNHFEQKSFWTKGILNKSLLKTKVNSSTILSAKSHCTIMLFSFWKWFFRRFQSKINQNCLDWHLTSKVEIEFGCQCRFPEYIEVKLFPFFPFLVPVVGFEPLIIQFWV